MLIKRSGKSFQELLAEQDKYNPVTKEGVAGALAGNKAVSDLQQVFLLRLQKFPDNWAQSWPPPYNRQRVIWQSGLKAEALKKLCLF